MSTYGSGNYGSGPYGVSKPKLIPTTLTPLVIEAKGDISASVMVNGVGQAVPVQAEAAIRSTTTGQLEPIQVSATLEAAPANMQGTGVVQDPPPPPPPTQALRPDLFVDPDTFYSARVRRTAEGLSSLVFPHDLPDEWRQRLPELVAQVEGLNRNLEILRPAIPALIAAAKAQRFNNVPDQDEVDSAAALVIQATDVAAKELKSSTPDFAQLGFAWRALKVAGRILKSFLYAVGTLLVTGAVWSMAEASKPLAKQFGEKLAKEFDGDMDKVVEGLRHFLDHFGWPS